MASAIWREILPPPHLGNRTQERSHESRIIDFFPGSVLGWCQLALALRIALELSNLLALKVKMEVLIDKVRGISFMTPALTDFYSTCKTLVS